MNEQYEREQMLLGSAAVEKLRRSHVAVFGIGGVGSYIAEALARAGVGHLTLVDHDTVSLSNLNRQLIALHSTVGRYKTDVMAERIRDIDPDCRVTAIARFYEPETREEFLPPDLDFIADAIDSVRSKTDLIETALNRGIPIISSMGTGNRLDPSQFLITDLAKTSGDPLARVMRRELKARGIVHTAVLGSTELPHKLAEVPAQPEGSRVVPGTVSWVPSSAGLLIAGYIVRRLIEE